MFTSLLFGMLVGLDNLQAGAALGLGGLDARRRWWLALGFALFEFGMVLAGAWLGGFVLAGETLAELPGSLVLIGLGLLFLTGFGPLIAWRRATGNSLKRQFLMNYESHLAAVRNPPARPLHAAVVRRRRRAVV